MKLLFAGSALVIASVVGWAALNWTIERVVTPRMKPAPPVYRFVNADGSGRPSVVWQTSTGPTDCEELVNRLRRTRERDPIALLMSSADASATDVEPRNVCSVFQLGDVERGARVQVLDECAGMWKVRVLTGALIGEQGCIETTLLRREPPR
jgi:hypothetical protein